MTDAATKPIQIVVNGQLREIATACSVTALLAALQIDPARVAVELNRVIVRKSDWDSTTVSSGSTLEIVQFVGGG